MCFFGHPFLIARNISTLTKAPLSRARTIVRTEAGRVQEQANFDAANKAKAAGADVVFTDVWASMGQEEERAVRAAAFAGYQVNDRLMTLTNPGCMVQHCLPAHRGEEITAEVFEAHAQEIFDEAENRLHAQKAVMYLLMCPDAK